MSNQKANTGTELATLPPKAQQMIKGLQDKLMAIQQKDMLRLGDGAALFIREAGVEKRAFKAKVELTCPEQFCFISKKPMICAPGLEKANQYAGIEIFKPQKLVANGGQEVMNPYYTMDNNGMVSSIAMRGIGIGYGPLGSLAAVDQTIIINMSTVLLQELQAKLKNNPTIAVLGLKDRRPNEFKASIMGYDERERRRVVKKTEIVTTDDTWVFIPVFGLTGYWLNVTAPDILDVFDGYIQKQRFIERTANTILRRQILSLHPAIGTKTPIVTCADKGNEKAYIVVYGFQPETDDAQKRRKEMEALVAKLAQGEKLANMEVVVKEDEVSDVVPDVHASEAADPSEIPIAPVRPGFEEEDDSGFDGDVSDEEEHGTDGAEVWQGEVAPPPHVEIEAPTTPVASAKSPAEELKEIFSNAAMKPAAQKACAEMKTSYSEIRKAKPEVISEFVGLVRKFANS